MPEDPKPDQTASPVKEEIKEGAYEVPDTQGAAIFYANHVNAMGTLMDYRLNFGLVRQVDSDNKAQVERAVTVMMSPELAKALYLTLQGSLRKYEENFGKIRFLPDSQI